MSFPLNVPLTGADVLRTTSDKRHPLGTRGVTRDGRSYRYARNGAAALVPGKICQSSVLSAYAHLLDSGTTKLSANSSKMTLVTSGNSLFTTRNAYADGYAFTRTTSTANGAGQRVQIRSHTTESLTATGLVVFNFVDGDNFYAASTNFGTTKIEMVLMRNPYDKVVVKPAGDITSMIVGVPNRPVAANHYFWLQTWGPCPVWCTGVAELGYDVGFSSGASAGCIDAVTCTKKTSAAVSLVWSQVRALTQGVGTAMFLGAAAEYPMVNLKLAP